MCFRRIIVALVAFVVMLTVVACSDNNGDKTKVTPELETANQTDISTPEPLPEPVVIEVDFSNMGITDSQLAQMVSSGEIPADVTHLKLFDNDISDISPLANLVELEGLWIWGNRFGDLTPLSGLTKLTGLWTAGREISDISPISNLTNLEYLHLPWASITDISPLYRLTNLKELHLQNNPLTYRVVNELRKALPNCEILFKSDWTIYVNGEEIEIDVVDTEHGPFIPVDVLRLFNGEVKYVVEDLIYPEFTINAATGINLWMNDQEFHHGQTFYDDFFLHYDGNKMVADYDWVVRQPTFLEFDGIPYMYAHFIEQNEYLFRNSITQFRRDNMTLYFEGVTDPSYEYLPRPRPTHWRLFINDEEMPIEVMHEPTTDFMATHTYSVYTIEYFDLFDAEYGVSQDGITRGGAYAKVGDQRFGMTVWGTANDRNRYGTMGLWTLLHPASTIDGANAGEHADGDWGVTSIEFDHYEWIIRIVGTWQVSDTMVAAISIEDLPPLVIAPLPPPLPEYETIADAFYRQPDEPELTNADLAQAVASGKIPANTTTLWIRLLGDNVYDLSPLVNLPELRYLYVSNSKVSDLTPLASMTKLETVWIEGSGVSDISPLVGLPNLRELYINRAPELRDISPVASMTNLTFLGFENTQVRDISPIRGLTNVEVLNLRSSPVRDITWLHGMTNLTELYLGGTRVPPEQVTVFQSSHGGCKIDSDVPT